MTNGVFYVYKITHIDRPEPRCCYVSWTSLSHHQVLRSQALALSADPAAAPLHAAIREGLDPSGLRIELVKEGLDGVAAAELARDTVREIGCIPPFGWNWVSTIVAERVWTRHDPPTVSKEVKPASQRRGYAKRAVRETTTGRTFESAVAAGHYFGVGMNTVLDSLNLGRPTRSGLFFVDQQK